MVTILVIISVLIVFNFILLKFSCNKKTSTSEDSKKLAVDISNNTSQRIIKPMDYLKGNPKFLNVENELM